MRRAWIWLLVALAFVLRPPDDGVAQPAPQAAPGAATPLEAEAYSLYNENKLVTARARAQAVLAQDPFSIMGHYVLGCVLREAEGSLARAMFHLGRAREVYEMRWGVDRASGAPWHLHREILFAIQALAGEMEQYEYQLHILEFHDSLYDPDLLAEHAWPLVHLGRYAEARMFAESAKRSADPWQRSLGLNALCAVESEARQRVPQLRACLEALAHARARAATNSDSNPVKGPSIAVHAYNAALAAAAALRHDEVERLSIEGTRRLEFTTANPWRILARLYTDEAKMDRAIDAVREMQRWRVRQPANLRDQDRAETDAAVAMLMLAGNEPETGIICATRALERPDRKGLVSSRPEQALGAHALLRRALYRLAAELEAERASVLGLADRARARAVAVGLGAQVWPDEQRVLSVLEDPDRLVSTLRMYVHGGLETVPSWLVGDLIEILGAGVVQVALAHARALEVGFPEVSPYYEALEAEIALAQGDDTRALAFAQSALILLPAAEAILAARTAAVGAEAARQAGETATSLALFERALQKDPGVLRRMGLAIPASVQVMVATAAAQEAGEMLEHSPRLEVGGGGFSVTVEPQGLSLGACLRSPHGALLGCTRVDPGPNEAPSDLARRLALEFHRAAFSLKVSLSEREMRDLDGTPVAGQEATREQMREVLNDLATEQNRQQ